jgi:NADPH:quinone reductase-like Zn-dependent oxidoreductase
MMQQFFTNRNRDPGMHALILEKPENPESLKIAELPMPAPHKQQVRIRFTSMGLNRADLLYCRNRYFFRPTAASRLGFEGAGYIDQLGAGLEGSGLKRGDRVAVLPMSFDLQTQGCFAEYGVYDAACLIPSPEVLDDSVTGAVWMAYLTAWGGMVECGGLKANETVVITAASSSVGIAAIQIAKWLGARVIASTSEESKRTALIENGADLVIIIPANLDGESLDEANKHYVDEVRTFTADAGSNLVFDAVAGPASYALVKASAMGGRIVFQGMLDRRPMNIHAGVLMKRRLTLRGYTLDETLNDSAQKTQAITQIYTGFIKKQLKPVIAQIHPLSSYALAFEQLSSNQHIGKIVLVPDRIS